MESYNNKRWKLLKIYFFMNLRKKIIIIFYNNIFLRAHFCVIKQIDPSHEHFKQNLENIVEIFIKITEKSYIFFDE